jgi:hypothetical protein
VESLCHADGGRRVTNRAQIPSGHNEIFRQREKADRLGSTFNEPSDAHSHRRGPDLSMLVTEGPPHESRTRAATPKHIVDC